MMAAEMFEYTKQCNEEEPRILRTVTLLGARLFRDGDYPYEAAVAFDKEYHGIRSC